MREVVRQRSGVGVDGRRFAVDDGDDVTGLIEMRACSTYGYLLTHHGKPFFFLKKKKNKEKIIILIVKIHHHHHLGRATE